MVCRIHFTFEEWFKEISGLFPIISLSIVLGLFELFSYDGITAFCVQKDVILYVEILLDCVKVAFCIQSTS
jgi:hypothetical protein